MKSKKLLIGLGLAITLVAGMGLNLGGCVTASTKLKVSDTSSYSQKEREIRQVMLLLEDAWNKRDAETFLSLFSEDAQIMVGRERRIVSKEEYKKMFPARFNDGRVKDKVLGIKMVNSSSAIVKTNAILLDKDGISLSKKICLVYDNKRWMINESTYLIEVSDQRRRHRGSGESLD